MSDFETREFYQGSPFILRNPLKCRTCGHIWEPPPSKLLALVMVLASGLCMILGFVTCVAPFLTFSATWRTRGFGHALGGASLLVLIGFFLMAAGLAALKKYIRYLY